MRCEQPDETADPSFTARSSRWISHSTKAMLAQPFLHIATRLLTSYGQSLRRYFGRHAHGRPDLHSALALDRPQYRAYSCLILTPASGAAKYLEGCTRRSRRRKPSKLHRAPNLLCRFHSANRKASFLFFFFFLAFNHVAAARTRSRSYLFADLQRGCVPRQRCAKDKRRCYVAP